MFWKELSSWKKNRLWVMGNFWIRKLYHMFVAKICMGCYDYLPFCHTPKAESTYVAH